MIGLELGISVACGSLAPRAHRRADGFSSDVVATAKRELKAGEMLDGEGGFTVWGKQMPAARLAAVRRAAARPCAPGEARESDVGRG